MTSAQVREARQMMAQLSDDIYKMLIKYSESPGELRNFHEAYEYVDLLAKDLLEYKHEFEYDA